ncbi:MAG: hypothetical protein FJ098_03340, partial [Deltaproteobacteria bacterium]|nr:hypothetical protein [Deltaproteobacteria bacterium]
YLYVLPTEQDCLDNGMEPGGYVYVPPPAGDVAEPPPEDVSEPPPEDMTGPPPEDTGPGDLSLPDSGPPTDTAPGPCPLIAGRYLVQIFNLAVKHLELELHLQQEGCTISEALGIIEGELDADGVLTVRSTFPDLHMEECSGTVEDPLLFEVDCGDGWFATFTQVL